MGRNLTKAHAPDIMIQIFGRGFGPSLENDYPEMLVGTLFYNFDPADHDGIERVYMPGGKAAWNTTELNGADMNLLDTWLGKSAQYLGGFGMHKERYPADDIGQEAMLRHYMREGHKALAHALFTQPVARSRTMLPLVVMHWLYSDLPREAWHYELNPKVQDFTPGTIGVKELVLV